MCRTLGSRRLDESYHRPVILGVIVVFRGSESSGKQPTTAVDRAEYHDRCTFGLPSTMCVSKARTISFGVETGGVSHKTW